jgi:hypothetical protein
VNNPRLPKQRIQSASPASVATYWSTVLLYLGYSFKELLSLQSPSADKSTALPAALAEREPAIISL